VFRSSEPPELSHFKANIARISFHKEVHLIVAGSYLEQTVFQSAVHAFKYGDMPKLARTIGQTLGKRYQTLAQEYDILIPIPLHSSKLSSRGYNQAEELSRGLAMEWKLPVVPYLKRTRATQTQTKLSLEDRILNTEHIFSVSEVDKKALDNKRVLLIDDVITTGSTVGNAIKVLLDARPQSIGVLALAATP